MCLHVCLFVRQCTWKPVYLYGTLGYPALKADRLKPHVNHPTDLSLTSTVTFSLLSQYCAGAGQVVEIKSSFQPAVHTCWTARRMAAGGSNSLYMPSRSWRGSPYSPYSAFSQLSCNRLTPLQHDVATAIAVQLGTVAESESAMQRKCNVNELMKHFAPRG